MISELIFNSDVFSGQILHIDHIKTTGAKSVFAAPINQFGTGSGSNIISLRSGQLGIGIIDPAFPLHVNGDGQLGGSFTVSGSSVIEGDNYTVSDSYIGGDFSVTGSSLTKGSSIIEGSSVIEGDNYTVSDSYIGGDFYVTGSSVINGDLTVNGESFVVEATTVKIEDKNLEIGISSTGAETDSTADGGGITLHGDTPKTILWSNATDSWDLSENVGVADGKFIFSDKLRARDSAGLSLEDDGGNGIFIEDGGDVGIGTTNPAVGLEINHTDALKIPKGTTVQRPTSNSATHKGYIRYNTTTDQFEGFGAGNAWGSLGGVVDVDQDTYISAENSAGSDNDELKFFTSGSARAIIDSAGNVGIGTTDPSSVLEVQGKQGYADSASNLLTSTTKSALRVRGSSDSSDSLWMGVETNYANPYIQGSNGTGDNAKGILINPFGGNVGIGTSSPNEKLDLNGILYLRNSTVPSTTTNRLYASGGNLFWNGQNVLDNVDTWRAISSTPADGATTTSISSDWAFDNVKTAVPANAVFTDTNTWRAISSTPADGETTTSISSDWAFDNVKTAVPANAVFTDTVPTFSYNSTTKTLTITT